MKNIISSALKSAGFDRLLDIQQESISEFSKGNDLVVLSKTGSGKTLAFLLPILNEINLENDREVQAVILSPTRELCLQIEKVFKSLRTGMKVTTCYGGHPMRIEKNSLSETPSIIIATPGRLCDHIRRENVDLSQTNYFAIDEFDKCLEFGFSDEINTIYSEFTHLKQHLLTSATRIDEYPDYLRFQSLVTLDHIKEDTQLDLIEYGVHGGDDWHSTLELLINSFGQERNMVFVNYREVCDDVVDYLEDAGIICALYHGGLNQETRERELIKFSNGSANTIVCTDLGSRGLDIPDVKHIVHFQYPSSQEAFTHRKGRTARMDGSGFSYLFVSEDRQLPDYIEQPTEYYSFEPQAAQLPEYETIYISGGKKEKIGKIDVVGFFSKIGKLKGKEIGLIDVKDHMTYVAIKRSKVNQVFRNIKGERMKGKRMKIARSK
jgi:superfamily II DNA/RNA helicase